MNQNNNYLKRPGVKKLSWIQKHPKLFFWTSLTSGLLIFFSRPIYDMFIRTDFAVPKSKINDE